MDLKITINLRKEEASAGSLNLTMGNLQVLLLHRVLRLVQMYFSPLDLKKVFARSLRVLHWIFGPSLKVLQSKEKHIGVKIKMDGPTLILPEQKENQDLFSIYLGQVSLENMMMKEGAVENLMLVVAGGQVTRAVMNMNQCIEQVDLIVDELGCKMDLKRNFNENFKRDLDSDFNRDFKKDLNLTLSNFKRYLKLALVGKIETTKLEPCLIGTTF